MIKQIECWFLERRAKRAEAKKRRMRELVKAEFAQERQRENDIKLSNERLMAKTCPFAGQATVQCTELCASFVQANTFYVSDPWTEPQYMRYKLIEARCGVMNK